MKKTALFLIITLLFTSIFCMEVFAEKEFSIILDGQKIDLAAAHTFRAGRTMVPLDSGIFEKFGSIARYDEATGKIWIEGEYSSVEMTLNEAVAYIHRKYDFTGIPMKVDMDVAPFVENGKVYIPLRFAAEGLDVAVEWDGSNNSVILTTSGNWEIIPVETPAVYEEINLSDIPEELTEWVEANRKDPGIHYTTADDKTYILVCAGEQPTGGYFLQLNSATVVAPGSIYITAQLIPPAQDMMVTQVLTYPCMLIAVEGPDFHTVDGTIDGIKQELTVKPVIQSEDIAEITLKNLDGETVKNYPADEFAHFAEAFNNSVTDDSFYIMMITGNQLTITMKDGTIINMTSYGSETNIVAAITSPDGSVQSLHLVCPEIAAILLGTEPAGM